MILRKLVLLIGLIILALGLSQVIFAHWWARVALELVSAPTIYYFVAFAFAAGIIFVAAGWKKQVMFRWFFIVLGVILLFFSVWIMVEPGMWGALTRTMITNRPEAGRVAVVMAAGLIRALIGMFIIYAARPRERNIAVSNFVM